MAKTKTATTTYIQPMTFSEAMVAYGSTEKPVKKVKKVTKGKKVKKVKKVKKAVKAVKTATTKKPKAALASEPEEELTPYYQPGTEGGELDEESDEALSLKEDSTAEPEDEE